MVFIDKAYIGSGYAYNFFYIPHIKNIRTMYLKEVGFSDGGKQPEKNTDIVTQLVLFCSNRLPEAV